MRVAERQRRRRITGISQQADEHTEQNVRYLYQEVTWAGISSGILGSFLAIFALRIGATAFQVGLLTTGPAVAGIIFPLFAARLVSRMWGKPVLVLPLALYRLVFIVVVVAPWAPANLRVIILVTAVALLSVPLAFFNTAFVPLLGKVLPPDIRAHVVGVRSTLAGLTATLAVLASGKILDALTFPLNFQVLFALGFVTAQVSTYIVGRVHLPPLNERRKTPRTATGAFLDPSSDALERGQTVTFWRHTISATIFTLGINLPVALYPIVQVDKLHATNGWIGAIAMTGGLAGVVFSPVWGRAAIRYGNRTVLVASGVMFAVVPIGASIAPNVLGYAAVALVAGTLTAGVNLSLFQCLVDVAPEGRQTHFMAVYAMAVNSAGACGPLLGTYLLATIGMSKTFWLAATCVALGGLLFWIVRTRPFIRLDQQHGMQTD